MLGEDQYIERTADIAAKVRAMREAAQKEMNRFTRLSDYDVRCVMGHGPKPAPVPAEVAAASPSSERHKKSAQKSVSVQAALEFTSASVEQGDNGESA